MHGELIPKGGGDPIPLMKQRLRIGRRETCDIILNFGNVSGHHCLMEMDDGFWYVHDLKSRNGIKVNDQKIMVGINRRLDPGDVLKIAKHEYEVSYDPEANGAYGAAPPQEVQMANFFSESLLDRAGLRRKQK